MLAGGNLRRILAFIPRDQGSCTLLFGDGLCLVSYENPKSVSSRDGRQFAGEVVDLCAGGRFIHKPEKRLVARPRQFASEHVDLYVSALHRRAEHDFGVYRRILRPNMQYGWFVAELAREAEQFYADLIAGRRPTMALLTPPQHGKSEFAIDFASWIAGKTPDLKTIYASYSDELGVRANRALQRTLSSESFGKIFPLRIGAEGWAANANLIEYADHGGSFRNVTVEGGVTGLALDLGIIDDPFKGRAEANSKLIRDKTWSWFTDEFGTRLSKQAGLLIVMTRWHIDDLLGRLLQRSPQQVRVLRYPALAERPEDHWISDWSLTKSGWRHGWKHVRRAEGAALFPELKPTSFLLEQRNRLSQASWQSLYQQNPIIAGGGQLPIEQLRVLNFFERANVLCAVRYWDKAGSDNDRAAYTAGVLMLKLRDNRFVIAHVARGRWGALEREQRIRRHAELDYSLYKNYCVIVEQEPGSGGKESAENTLRNLAGFIAWLQRGARRTFCSPGASRQCFSDRWRVGAAVPGRMRILAKRQVQRSGGRGGRRVEQANPIIV
jgi:hypothetical protein